MQKRTGLGQSWRAKILVSLFAFIAVSRKVNRYFYHIRHCYSQVGGDLDLVIRKFDLKIRRSRHFVVFQTNLRRPLYGMFCSMQRKYSRERNRDALSAGAKNLLGYVQVFELK